MRSEVDLGVNSRLCEYASSYVQVNIYNTNIRELQEKGVDLRRILQHIDCHSIIMDVPILKAERTVSSACSLNTCGTNPLACHTQHSRLYRPVRPYHSSFGKPLNKRPSTASYSTITDGFTQFEGEYVSHDNVQQFHMDQYAENEMEIKRKEEFTECATHGTAMDESDYGSRPNIVHENYLDKAKMPSCLSFTNYLDASSSKEFPVTLSCSAICSTSGGNSFLQSNNFSKSCEGPNFVTNESESKKLEVFTVVASMTTVPCVEEDVQILFRHSDIVHEALHVDEKGKSVSCKPEELELRVSFSKFSHDLESLSNIGARAEQTCIQTVRRPAFGSMCKLFVDFKESVVDDKRVASRNNYVIMRRMSSVPKFYHCKIEGCKQCIRLRYGYGKQRLLEHVRAHWGKLLKKCKLCTFRASHAYKVYYHHKCKHSGSDFFQAESLETKEDMKELLQMWKLCFDAEPPRCLRPEASSAFCHRIVGFLHYRNKYFSATVYKLTLSVPNVMRRHPMKTFTMMMCDGCM